jgi:hypothetical protein
MKKVTCERRKKMLRMREDVEDKEIREIGEGFWTGRC